MWASKKVVVDDKLLQDLVPLNALSMERFWELSEKIIVEEVRAKRYLFRKGDKENQSTYLLKGTINLIDGSRKVTAELAGGTDQSRYPIANQLPIPVSARDVKKCIIARIDSVLLDVFLKCDEHSNAEAVEIGSDENTDWMTRFLQTETFTKIPPAMLQSLLIKMESFPVEAGEVVIHQGDPGDYFYTIREGRCAVTRKDSLDAEDQLLTELGRGSSFGEEALVSDAVRNATVTMQTDGLLMRLSKTDFIELLKNQLVKHIDYEQAVAMVNEGAVWLDVRTKEEYECGTCDEDSVNIPLSDLRDEMSELVFNAKYIIYGDTGGSGESAAFLLSHHGFDVYVLKGEIPQSSSVAGAVETAIADNSTADVADNIHIIQSAEHIEQLASLRAENERLLEEVKKYQTSEARMREQIQQQRDELCELGEKLESMHARKSGNA